MFGVGEVAVLIVLGGWLLQRWRTRTAGPSVLDLGDGTRHAA
jgi:hypothetical protein